MRGDEVDGGRSGEEGEAVGGGQRPASLSLSLFLLRMCGVERHEHYSIQRHTKPFWDYWIESGNNNINGYKVSLSSSQNCEAFRDKSVNLEALPKV